jgi:hypothetical protein
VKGGLTMRRLRVPTLTLLATVPYLLLSGAQQVAYETHVFPNGAGYRFMTVDVTPDRADEIGRYAQEAQKRECNFEEREKLQGVVRIERNFWAPAVERLPDTQLKVNTLLSEPLSLYTTYEFSETLKFFSDDATDVEKAGAQKATLQYVLQMPGAVDESSLSPSGQVEGGKVTFKLTGDKPEYTIKATSRQLRYGTLAVLLYLLACVAVFGGRFLRSRIGNRPRKI